MVPRHLTRLLCAHGILAPQPCATRTTTYFTRRAECNTAMLEAYPRLPQVHFWPGFPKSQRFAHPSSRPQLQNQVHDNGGSNDHCIRCLFALNRCTRYSFCCLDFCSCKLRNPSEFWRNTSTTCATFASRCRDILKASVDAQTLAQASSSALWRECASASAGANFCMIQ